MLGAPVFRTALFVPWPGNALWTAARAVPSLDLPFADSKSLVDAITGRQLISFARAGSGTYTDSAGVLQTAATDVPRFDHNPLTGESLGLLVEEQRTNLKTYSDAILSVNGYAAVNATLATITTATPTGSATASLFTMNAGANTGNNTDGFNFGSATTLANSTQHTQSLFVKPAGATVLRLRSNVGGTLFDFTLTGNGTAPSPSLDLQTASIVAFANGWYRVSWTFTTTTSAPGNRGDYWTIKTNVADGTNGVYVVGAQLEAGATASSYIPTTTAAATRNADVAQITGTNFSSWYRQDEGTLFCDALGLGAGVPVSDFQSLATFSDGTNATRIELGYLSASSAYWNLRSAGSSSVEISPTVSAARRLLAASYSSALAEISVNGAAALSDSSVTVPLVNKLDIGGANGAAIKEFNGHIRRLTFWPQRLDNATIQSLSQP
jgi:hypothetical protein